MPMKQKKEQKDKTKNNIFAAAVDHLRRVGIIKTQLELAKLMGVNKDTISNIMNCRTAVTDDAITRLQTASGCIFNLQWLRGESSTMLAAETKNGPEPPKGIQNHSESFGPEISSIINAIISAQADTVASLKRELVSVEDSAQQQLAAKEETIQVLHAQLDDRQQLIESLQQQVKDLRERLEKTERYGYPMSTGAAEQDRRNPATP